MPLRGGRIALLIATCVVLASVLGESRDAAAFDCPESPAAAPLENLDAALIGVPVERLGEVGVFDVMRFEVLEAVKGSIGDEAVLLVATAETYEYSDATLTVDGARFGQEAGLQIYDETFPRVAEECTGTHPDFIRAAAEVLPQPDSSLVVEAVSVGQDLGTTHRLVGESGGLAAYVDSDDALYHARFCSDGVTLVETYRSSDGASVRWRDTATLEVVAEAAVPDPRRFGATIVVDCVRDNRMLLRTSDSHIVMDPDGTLVRTADDMFSGKITNIALSNDGETVAAIIDRERLEVGQLNDTSRVASELDVTGRVLSHVAVSPDGDLVAFLRGGDKQRLVIVDREGVEQQVIIDPAYGRTQVINWVDAETIATGGAAITQTVLTGDTPTVVVYDLATFVDQELGYVDPPTHRTAVVTADGPAVLDLRSGSLVSLDGIRPRGIVLAAPAPLRLEVNQSPRPEVEFPLPGGRVPATLDELVEVLRQNPDRFDAAAIDLLAAASGESEDPDAAIADSDSDLDPQSSTDWVIVGLAIAGAALVAFAVRRWFVRR